MLEISVPRNYLLLLKFITAKYLVHMCEQKELKSWAACCSGQLSVCVCHLFTRYTHMLGKIFGWSSPQCSCSAVPCLAILMLLFYVVG